MQCIIAVGRSASYKRGGEEFGDWDKGEDEDLDPDKRKKGNKAEADISKPKILKKWVDEQNQK